MFTNYSALVFAFLVCALLAAAFGIVIGLVIAALYVAYRNIVRTNAALTARVNTLDQEMSNLGLARNELYKQDMETLAARIIQMALRINASRGLLDEMRNLLDSVTKVAEYPAPKTRRK